MNNEEEKDTYSKKKTSDVIGSLLLEWYLGLWGMINI